MECYHLCKQQGLGNYLYVCLSEDHWKGTADGLVFVINADERAGKGKHLNSTKCALEKLNCNKIKIVCNAKNHGIKICVWKVMQSNEEIVKI